MDPLSRCVGSRSASDLAGLIVAAEADSCYSTDACSFSLSSAAVIIGSPETPKAAQAAVASAATAADASAVNAAVDLSGGSSDDEMSPPPPRLRHPESVADSLYCRSEPGTSEFSVGGDEDDTTLLTECLRRVLRIDGLDGAAAAAPATVAVPDCCVYANCNCGQTLQPPPPPPAPLSPTAKGVGSKEMSSSGCKMRIRRGGGGVGGCRCCCIS